MVLLGDEGKVEAHFSPFGDSFNLDARLVHGLPRTYHGNGNHFGAHPMVLLGDVDQGEACFGLYGDSVNLGAR